MSEGKIVQIEDVQYSNSAGMCSLLFVLRFCLN